MEYETGGINTMPPEQIGHAKLCLVVDGKEIEIGDFFCNVLTETDVDHSRIDDNIPDLKPISGTIRIKPMPCEKFRIKRYLKRLFKDEFRNRFKSRYRRTHQIRQYLKLRKLDPNLFYELFLPRKLELDDIKN